MTMEAAGLRLENERLKDVLTSVMYAQSLERYAVLHGLRDNLCPACGSAVNIITDSNGNDRHGNGGVKNAVRLEPRWKP